MNDPAHPRPDDQVYPVPPDAIIAGPYPVAPAGGSFGEAVNLADQVTMRAQSLRRSVLALQRSVNQQRDQIYDDIAELGVALGHPNTARPESPRDVFRGWVNEVRQLRTELDRTKRELAELQEEMADQQKEDWE